MSLSNVPERGGATLRFRVGRVPVSIHVSSPIVLALLGPGLTDVPLLVIWVAVGLVSIIIHELGHAWVVRRAGGTPRVDLQWLGGLTRYQPTERLHTRRWSIAVSLAGPATGIVIGLLLRWVAGNVTVTGPYVARALEYGYFVSLVWAVFNLAPIMPLDGGQALRELLPGNRAQRTRRAAMVGVGVGGVIVALALWANQVYVALLVGLMTWQNVRLLRSTVVADRGRPLAEDHTPELADHVAMEDLRSRARVGRASAEELTAAVRAAAQDGKHLQVVELVNMALGHGVGDHRLPWQAARSWVALDQRDRANRMVRAALDRGASPHELLADSDLAPLRDHPRFPLADGAG